MSWFRRNQTILGLALLTAFILVSGVVDYQDTEQVFQSANRLAHSQRVSNTLSALLSSLTDAETGERGYLITGLPSYLEPYNRAVSTIGTELWTLKQLTLDNPTQQQYIAILEKLVPSKLAELDRTISVRREGSFEAAQTLVMGGEGKQAMDTIRERIADIQRIEDGLLQQRTEATRRSYRAARFSGLCATLLALALVGITAFLLRRDFATRERAATALQEQREWFRTTLSSIGDAVIATDDQGRVSFMNDIAQQLTGWKEADAIGSLLPEVFCIVDEQTRESPENPVARVLDTGQIVGLANHTVLVAKDGTEHPIDDSVAPIRDRSGQLRGVVLVFRDISERRQAELAVKAADRRKDEFLAMLAHELRNPIAPIRNAVKILQRLCPPEQQQLTRMHDILERQVEHLTSLVDDLMDVSRITRGKIVLNKQPTDLREVVAHAVETVRPLIDARKHALNLELAHEPIWVDGDEMRLVQVVTNLLNNAAKYTDEGGHIAVRLEAFGTEAALRVRDNGIGIAAELLPDVFDLFTQAQRSADRSQGGLGIGLTLVKRLVQMHHGRVEAFSAGLATGSEFIVHLPLSAQPQITAALENAFEDNVKDAPAPVSSLRILVVDDNTDAAESLALLLQLAGHEVQVALDGLAALEIASVFRPQVVVLDIGLPGTSGNEVARAMRARPATHRSVLIALTGYSQGEDKIRSQQAGFDHYLVKPPKLDALLDLISSTRADRNPSG